MTTAVSKLPKHVYYHKGNDYYHVMISKNGKLFDFGSFKTFKQKAMKEYVAKCLGHNTKVPKGKEHCRTIYIGRIA